MFADEYPEPEAIDSLPEQVRVRLHVVSALDKTDKRVSYNVIDVSLTVRCMQRSSYG